MSISALNNEQTSNTQLLDQVKDTTISVVTGIGTALVMKESQAPLIQALTSIGLKPVQVGVGAIGFPINAFVDVVLNNLSKLPLPQWLKARLTQNANEAKKNQSVEFIKKSTLYLLTTFLYVYAYSYLFKDEKDHNANTLFTDTLYQAVLYLPYTLITHALKDVHNRTTYNASISALLSYI